MARDSLPPGFGSGFDAARFREAILATMTMGLPDSVDERATFRWPQVRTFERQDPARNPYSWDDVPEQELVRPDVRIPVAVEFASSYGVVGETTIGSFDATRAIVTVLDSEFPKIEGASEVLLGGNTYVIDYWAPPQGLFDVTIYRAYCTARDES